jgi:CysZ protein
LVARTPLFFLTLFCTEVQALMNTSTTLITGPLAGAAYLLRGLDMLRLPELRHFVWVPLLVNLVLFSLAIGLGFHYFSAVLDWLMPAWLDWLRWLLWPLFALVLFVFAFFSFTVVANLIASPFYGPLAGKVLEKLGSKLSGGVKEGRLGSAIVADLGSQLRRMRYFAARALPLLLASAIPGVNLIAGLLWIVFGAWSLSLEYMAYPLETQGILFPQQREMAKANRWETLGFGMTVLLGLSIPLLNILIPPAAVIGATLYIAERRRDNIPN